jgi:DNA-binding FadR family transcriptional regulator
VPLETIEHTRLYRQVADQLRALIEDGEWLPGARLPAERELAEKLGISRPTLREALIVLEVEGKIRIRLGSGIYVAEAAPATPAPIQAVQAEGPFEVLHARELIEASTASEAALTASAEDIAGLRRIIDGMAATERPNPELIRLDREFHVALASILGNSLLARVVGELFDQRINPYFNQLASHFENSGSWMFAVTEHRLIHDRIAARDASGASAAMRAHLRAAADRYSQSFGETALSRPSGKKSQPPIGRREKRDTPA